MTGLKDLLSGGSDREREKNAVKNPAPETGDPSDEERDTLYASQEEERERLKRLAEENEITESRADPNVQGRTADRRDLIDGGSEVNPNAIVGSPNDVVDPTGPSNLATGNAALGRAEPLEEEIEAREPQGTPGEVTDRLDMQRERDAGRVDQGGASER